MDPGEFETWDDNEIFVGGIEPSLLQSMRNRVQSFLENTYIYRLILVMTIVLCVVILLELSFDDSTLQNPDGSRNPLG